MGDPRFPGLGGFSIELPAQRMSVSTRKAKLIQAPGAHDVLHVTTSNNDRFDELLEGAPVTSTWRNDVAEGTFCGYIHRIDPTYSSDPHTSEILCVGASQPLMARDTRIWVQERASDVVRSIASLHQLTADVEDHPRVYEQVMQAGDSYWGLLNRLAKETGYVLRMEGAMLVFRSRDSLNRHFRPEAPIVDLRKKAGDEAPRFTPMAGRFNPELGATLAHRTSFGVDPATGSTLTSSHGAPPHQASFAAMFAHPLVDRVVSTEREAVTAAQAAQEENRFSITAELLVAGDPYFAPERVIYLRAGAGSDRFTGYWTIRKVEHEWERGRYHCRMLIGIDGLGGPIRGTGEPDTPPSGRVKDPHRPGALDWGMSKPVLRMQQSVLGSAGEPLTDFRWTSVVSEWSTR